MPVNLILRVQKVDVTSGADRLAQLLSQLDDGTVELPQLLFVLYPAFSQQKGVVAQGLDLQVVVKSCDAFKLRPILIFLHRLEQLSRFAGCADNQSLTVSSQLILWNQREPLEILQVGHGDKLVEIFQAHLIFCQQDNVFGVPVGLPPGAQLRHSGVDCL